VLEPRQFLVQEQEGLRVFEVGMSLVVDIARERVRLSQVVPALAHLEAVLQVVESSVALEELLLLSSQVFVEFLLEQVSHETRRSSQEVPQVQGRIRR
jgi:hypothetical protein